MLVRNKMIALVAAFLAIFGTGISIASSGPDDRQLTDPRSIVSPVNPEAKPISIEKLFYTRSVSNPAWSPDGQEIVFTSNFTGRLNLWKVRASGGWPIQLSQSDDRETNATWSPDGKWIVYQSDHGGNETYELFAIPSDGGDAINLTNTTGISETSPHFSPDGASLAINYKPRNSPITDIALMDRNTHAVRNLTKEVAKDRVWQCVAWSPDGKYIYANRSFVGHTDSDIYRIDASTGERENLTPHNGQIVYTASSLSPDGRALMVTSNQKDGYNNVALLDVTSKTLTWVTHTRWAASSGNFAPHGSQFTYNIDEDGRTQTFVVDRHSLRAVKLNLPEGLNFFTGNPSTFSPDANRLLVSHQSSNCPEDIWVYNITEHRTTQLTFSTIAGLNPKYLPESHLVHYKTFDGKIISAYLWVPFNLKRNALNPGIVLPHGGPTGQTVDYFNRTAAALASRGYVCISPNVRGSTGYGLEFQNANHQDLGGGDLQDEVYAAHFIADTGYVDAKKIGITGGSYGGFLTLMAIGKTPDLWAAAVEQYGIINWITMFQHEDPLLQEYEKSLLGDPVKDQEVYENHSPLKFIRNAKAPLLVLQGESDIRVPKEEAEQVLEAFKSAGKVVDIHYYVAEGHGFAKRENQIDAIQRTVSWFDRYLKTTDVHSADSQK